MKMDDKLVKMGRKELMDEVTKLHNWLLTLKARTPHKWLQSEIENLLEKE